MGPVICGTPENFVVGGICVLILGDFIQFIDSYIYWIFEMVVMSP